MAGLYSRTYRKGTYKHGPASTIYKRRAAASVATAAGRAAAQSVARAVTRLRSGASTSYVARRAVLPRGVETKAVDFAFGTTLTLTSTPQFTLLNGIQEGAGAFNRIGRRISLQQFQLQGFLQDAGVTTNGVQWGRIMLIYDRQPNATVPQFADLIQSETQTGALANSVVAGRNMDGLDRFVILWDDRFVMPQVTYTAGVLSNVVPFPTMLEMRKMCSLPLKGLETTYKTNTNPSTVADIATGSLYLVTMGDDAAPGWNLAVSMRTKFVDS